MGLLYAAESKRIGGGSQGFSGIQNDPWFNDLDWVQLLTKQLPPPWVPPQSPDGAAESDANLNDEPDGVMVNYEYDRQKWDSVFANFGPTLPTPTQL